MITNDIWTIGNNLMFLTGLRLGKNTYKAKRERALAPTNRGVYRKPRAISASSSIAKHASQLTLMMGRSLPLLPIIISCCYFSRTISPKFTLPAVRQVRTALL